MAPEKKLPSAQPAHIKENKKPHGQMHSHSRDSHTKKGLEILDFHESWLEEVELYKNKKHAQSPPLINGYPKPKNNQLEAMINHTGRLDVSNKYSAAEAANKSNRLIARNGTTIGGGPPMQRQVGGEAQLVLKRLRDEAKSQERSAKRTAQTPATHPHGMGQTPAQSGSPPKVIVNQFHASNKLSSPLGDKTKILVQNGLINNVVTAYEVIHHQSPRTSPTNNAGAFANVTSQPATQNGLTNADNSQRVSHSLSPENKSNSVQSSLPNGFYNAIPNVTAYRTMRSRTLSREAADAFETEVDYFDSESDGEEYVGEPFYIGDEANKIQQSSNVRLSTAEGEQYFTPTCVLSPSLFPNVAPYLNFASHSKRGPPMPVALHKVLKWKLSPVMPKIVKRVVLNSGFRIIKNTTDWMAIWEKHMKSPGFSTIRSHQKYNHMPGSFRIGRKDTMWRNIHNNMKKFGTDEFGFMQKTYIMPDDQESLRQVWSKNASRQTKWIVKPPASARGTGIRIINRWSQFNKDRPLIVQKYIERPLLINENKFDMRIYVLVTSINPLRIFMYKDGLARFASVKYSSELNSLDDRCIHLTNYSINKYSQNYAKNEDFNSCQGHKWTLQSLWSCLENRGVNTKRLWATLRNLVIKSIVSGESGLNRMYRQNVNFRYNCFELFGFDVLLDENLVPWLLEINISPSLHSELPLDLHIKGPLIQAVLNTALYQVPPKLSAQQQLEIARELGIKCADLCYDKRLFVNCLTAEEVRKHNMFTNRSIEFREEYLDAILEELQPDDVRCLLLSEDELSRSEPLERIFPTADTHKYLKYTENPRYYNRLLDAWEHKYSKKRADGIALLTRLCKEGYHLLVSQEALDKEPSGILTEIDLLYVKKVDQPDSTALSDHTAKAVSPGARPHSPSSV